MTANLTKRTLFGVSALLFLFLFCSLPASADATYVYTGNPFTNFSGLSCSGTCNISVTITFATPLGDNLNFASVAPLALSFSISDGSLGDSINQSDELSGSLAASFSTDAGGNITAWFVQVVDGADTFDLTTASGFSGSTFDQFSASTGPFAANSNDAGTWKLVSSTSPTPEPSSLLLLGTGLLGLGPFIRRRLAKP